MMDGPAALPDGGGGRTRDGDVRAAAPGLVARDGSGEVDVASVTAPVHRRGIAGGDAGRRQFSGVRDHMSAGGCR